MAFEAGRPVRAIPLLEQAVEEILEGARYQDGIARARRALGRIAQAEGAHDEAMTLFTEALAAYASVSARFEVARTHLALAELMPLRGDRPGAERHLRGAHRRFTALQVPRYVGRAEAVARELAISL